MRNNKSLPQLLLLKRKFITNFPNGYQVGLYYSDDLKQFISIPLQDSVTNITKESIIEQLQTISNDDVVDTIRFNDNSELNVNKEISDLVIEYHNNNDMSTFNFEESDTKFLELLSQATSIIEETQEIEQG